MRDLNLAVGGGRGLRAQRRLRGGDGMRIASTDRRVLRRRRAAGRCTTALDVVGQYPFYQALVVKVYSFPQPGNRRGRSDSAAGNAPW
jgi:hypothetical protein